MEIKRASLALLAALADAQGVFAQPPDCASGAFLKRYSRAELVKFSPAGAMEIQLVADLHAADCGTPDCYGTRVRLSMQPVRAGACQYNRATVETEDYNACGEKIYGQKPGKKTETFVSDRGAFNLLDPRLTRITLMNRAKTRAIVLAPDDFFYFENVKPQGKLHLRLANDDDNEQKCCWGASMSRVHFREDEP